MDETKKVSWNASEGIIMEISNRRSYANTHFINGEIRKAFNTLIAIKQSVIQSFKPDERDRLKELERRFSLFSRYLYSSSASSWNKGTREAFILSKKIADSIYSEYNDFLMDSLEKYGYLIREQTDASRMKF